MTRQAGSQSHGAAGGSASPLGGARGRGLRVELRAGLAALLLAAGLAACTPIETGHGYVPTPEELAALTPGTDTRDSVAAAIGRPALTGVLEEDSWFYIRSTYRQIGAAPPEEVNRDIVVIAFDAEGRLTTVERLGLADARAVAITRRVTDSGVRPVGLLDQLGRNLGRISADQVLSQP